MAFINSVSAGSSTGADVQTANVDASGANLAIVFLACSEANASTPSDSLGSSFGAAFVAHDSATFVRLSGYLVTIVGGAGYWVKATGAGSFSSIGVLLFSNGAGTVDLTNSATDPSNTTLQPGSAAIATANEIVATAFSCGVASGAATVTSPFDNLGSGIPQESVQLAGGQHFPLFFGYEIQAPGPTSRNPTWTSGSSELVAVIASFQTTAGGVVPQAAYLDRMRRV